MSYSKKLLLFITPLVIFFCVPLVILFWTGEFISDQKVTDLQKSNEPVLVDKIFFPLNNNFVIENIQKRCPKILTLGNSRILVIRKEFFKSDNFYNGGGSMFLNVDDFNKVLNDIPASCQPELIILELDQSFFNIRNNNLNMESEPNFEGINLNTLTTAIRSFWNGLFRTKDSLINIFKDQDIKKIGMAAYIRNSGLRNDGSYYYGDIIKNNSIKDDRFDNTITSINGNVAHGYFWGKAVNNLAIEKLNLFLTNCQKRKIKVIGLLPPYAPIAYQKMMQSNNFEFINKIFPLISELFKGKSFEAYDFTSMNDINDSDFLDGLHGSEKIYLNIFLEIAKKGKILKNYINYDSLRALNDKSSGNLFVFPN